MSGHRAVTVVSLMVTFVVVATAVLLLLTPWIPEELHRISFVLPVVLWFVGQSGFLVDAEPSITRLAWLTLATFAFSTILLALLISLVWSGGDKIVLHSIATSFADFVLWMMEIALLSFTWVATLVAGSAVKVLMIRRKGKP